MASRLVDTRGLNVLMTRELPTATRNAVNDIARDVVGRERLEIKDVFDQPRPYIVRSVRMIDKATKNHPVATIGIPGSAGKRALGPHIPGRPRTRQLQGMERALTAAGILRRGQWLVPSNTAKLDRHGNLSRAVQRRMISDVTSASGSGTYIWGHVRGRRGQLVSGIWNRRGFESGRPGSLIVVVVEDQPDYQKIFRFYEVGMKWADHVAERHIRLAVRFAIARRG